MNRFGPFVLLLVTGVGVGIPLAAQEVHEAPATARSTLYLELGGNGGLFSLNADRRVGERLVLRVGVADWTTQGWTSDRETSLTTVPITASHLFGTGSSRFELGGGLLAGRRTEEGGFWGEPRTSGRFASLTGIVGYRRQPEGRGFMYRISFTPFLGISGGEHAYPVSGFFPSAGLSVGYAF